MLPIFFCLCLVGPKAVAQTSYTWNGSTSSAWNDNLNWTPNTGFPVAGDNVTINGAGGANQPVLNEALTLNSLTVSGGTLDLNTFALTVSGTPDFSGGNVNNGALSLASAAGTCTFGATTFGAAVTGSAASVLLNGATFNNTLTITKTGTANDTGSGNTTFNGTTTITNSGSAILRLANVTRDIFNADVTFTNTGSSAIYPAYNGTNTEFNGNVVVNSTAGLGVDFGQVAGTATLADGKTISVGSTGFTTGDLQLRNFTQTGAIAQTLTLTGTAVVYYQTGTAFNGNLTSVSPGLRLDGATFNGINNFTQNDSISYFSKGGNIFNAATTIKNSGSGIMNLANISADDYNADVTFIRTGSAALNPAYNTNCTFSGNISTAGSTSIITFSAAAGGRVTIDGNIAQAINGSSSFPPTIVRLTINNSAADLTLNVPVTVSTDLVFTSRNIITTSANLLTLSDNSTIAGVSNSSYVNGPVRKAGDDAFTFPTGKGGYYRPIAISAPALTTDHFTAENFNANPHLIYDFSSKDPTINNISICEYWLVDRTAGTSNVNVTLSWNTTALPGCEVNTPADLTVARWDAATSTWQDHGNGGTTGTNTSGTVVSSTAVTTFSPFALASTTSSNPLPIELLSFSGNCNKGNAVLKWRTATETNNAHFTIEQSINGVKWQAIGKVDGAGNSAALRDYSFTDNKYYNGVSYYRLKQTDYDGKFEYSEIIAAENCKEDLTELNIYPNPSNGMVNLVFKGDKAQINSVEIYNVLGEKVYYSDSYKSVINLANKQSGIYFLHLYLISKKIIEKITIER